MPIAQLHATTRPCQTPRASQRHRTYLQAVIMVIDSSERERIETVKHELNTLLSHEVS